jgi:hypothetical protein
LNLNHFRRNFERQIRNLDRHDGVFSQSYQDKLIQLITNNFEINNFCVEVGFNASELLGGSGSNCANLIVNNSWSALLLDAEHENLEINLRKVLLTPENIVETFKHFGVPVEPGYISIDVDSIDLFLFKSCGEYFKPLLFSVEYNANFPFGSQVTASPIWRKWENNKAFGTSLSALIEVADSIGYSLLWVVEPFDAFFIRKSAFEKDPGRYIFHRRNYRNKTLIDVHKPLAKNEDHSFIDYKVFSKTGSLDKARLGFEKSYSKYLYNRTQNTPRGRMKIGERYIKSKLKKLLLK